MTVDNISNRNQYIPADFDAVIILSGIKQFNPLPEAAEYIKKHNYTDRTATLLYDLKFFNWKQGKYRRELFYGLQ